MIRNVSEYLKSTAAKYPNKIAFVDDIRSITFSELQIEASHIAIGLSVYANMRKPIAVFLRKSVECVGAFMGIVMSGNFYTPIDIDMPTTRIQKIMSTLEPKVVLTDRAHIDAVREFFKDSDIVCYEGMMGNTIDFNRLVEMSDRVLDSDLLYVLFTSGSTGMPKGVMISEKGVIDFVEWATEKYDFSSETVFGNQTPFYFSFSIYEIYITLKTGATTYIIPHELFSIPVQLMQYLYDKRINTIVWVPSALTMVSAFRALKSPFLIELRNVFFGAEVMPVKQLNRWRKAYPGVRFVNLYGPTEVTDTCTAYEINREFEENEMLPIGEACRNKEVFLLNDNDELAKEEEIGELCIRGSGISYGYYNAPEKTAEVFVQNPLNPYVPELIYRTGDLAKYNAFGELVYISRKDFQIKHMGYRIELGEIEVNAYSVVGVEMCCCIFDKVKSKIQLFFTGNINESELSEQLTKLLPIYMMPTDIVKIDKMPFNLNGKIDRQSLKELVQ